MPQLSRKFNSLASDLFPGKSQNLIDLSLLINFFLKKHIDLDETRRKLYNILDDAFLMTSDSGKLLVYFTIAEVIEKNSLQNWSL